MNDPDTKAAPSRGDDAKVREEWHKLEQERIDEEIAEAREDAGLVGPTRSGPRWLLWLAVTVALLAGIALAAWLNR